MENYKSFNLTATGAVHIRNGTICQDSSSSGNFADYAYAVVCDGHGGEDYFRSDKGSLFGKEAVIKCFSDSSLFTYLENADTEKKRDEIIFQLEKSIVAEWNSSVMEHYNKNPFTDDELSSLNEHSRHFYENKKFIEQAYGTTLIAVAITEKYWFCIQIGDGRMTAFTENHEFIQPVPWDKRCFLNITTSMCDEYAIKCFRHYFSTDLPLVLFVSTDGVENSFVDNKTLNNFYELIIDSFKTMPFEQAVRELEDYLPILSEKGSGDDISIASVMNIKLM